MLQASVAPRHSMCAARGGRRGRGRGPCSGRKKLEVRTSLRSFQFGLSAVAMKARDDAAAARTGAPGSAHRYQFSRCELTVRKSDQRRSLSGLPSGCAGRPLQISKTYVESWIVDHQEVDWSGDHVDIIGPVRFCTDVHAPTTSTGPYQLGRRTADACSNRYLRGDGWGSAQLRIAIGSRNAFGTWQWRSMYVLPSTKPRSSQATTRIGTLIGRSICLSGS